MRECRERRTRESGPWRTFFAAKVIQSKIKTVRQGAPYVLSAWPLFVPNVVGKYARIGAATAIERLRGNTAGFRG